MNNAPAAADTFLNRLRHNTSESHTKLEQLPLSVSIINPEVTKKQYLLYLSLMHDIVKQAEENVFPALNSVISDLEERRKKTSLEEDMAFLKFSKNKNNQPLGDTSGFSTAFAMGIFYVLEGSTLGGRVILKNISETLGYDAENGASYFSGYGGQTGSRWKNFLHVLQAYAENNDCEDEIIAGADFAFNAIHRHFSQNYLDSI